MLNESECESKTPCELSITRASGNYISRASMNAKDQLFHRRVLQGAAQRGGGNFTSCLRFSRPFFHAAK